MSHTAQRLDLGAAIRQARTSANLSQADVAAALGVTQPLVSYWENHRVGPASRHLLVICEITGMSMNELFELATKLAEKGGEPA